MAEVTLDLRDMPRARAYTELDAHVRAILDGVHDEIAAMATMSALLHHGFGHLWTGFYRVVEPERRLLVGPYQGTLGCLEIAFGRGVCGQAAVTQHTIIVPDVNAFPDHIVCDARARSEIVVPVFAARGRLVAVLDIDSGQPGAFTDQDRAGLEQLLRWFNHLD